jgi:hypothetical protein
MAPESAILSVQSVESREFRAIRILHIGVAIKRQMQSALQETGR